MGAGPAEPQRLELVDQQALLAQQLRVVGLQHCVLLLEQLVGLHQARVLAGQAGAADALGLGLELAALEAPVGAAVARDGTPVFEIQSEARPERGSSGSPVLDDQNRVVGMYTWNDIEKATSGIAISSTALVRACPSAHRL